MRVEQLSASGALEDINFDLYAGEIVGVTCLLYTSDAADERSSVDLGGRRIIKKKKQHNIDHRCARINIIQS